MMHSQHLTDRWRDRRRRSSQDEKGLALLDVLIGIAIFALIAIIAVTAISQYRARAYESGTVSDARQIGIAEEALFVDNGDYLGTRLASPGDDFVIAVLTDEQLEELGVNLTEGNLAQVYVYTETNGERQFGACVAHESGAAALYASEFGGIEDSVRSGFPDGCWPT